MPSALPDPPDVPPPVVAAASAEVRPLAGRRILVTRPAEQAGPLAERLQRLGAEVLLQPAIRITNPPEWVEADSALVELESFDWLVFSSVHGVRYLLDRLGQCGGGLGRLAGRKLAAIGPGTAEELARYGLRADLVPSEYRAEPLAEALIAQGARGTRYLLARASRGREVLAKMLTAAGGEVRQVVVYSSFDVNQPDPQVARLLAAGQIDWVMVTSSAIARSLVRLFGPELRKTRLASISPLTSGVLRESGYEVAAEAANATMEGVVEAIVAGGRR